MKDIADKTNMPASVLSSLYSSVLPTFARSVKKGMTEEEALDYALSQVNNVSKKRLLGNLTVMKGQLLELEPVTTGNQKEIPFVRMLTEEMNHSDWMLSDWIIKYWLPPFRFWATSSPSLSVSS